MRSTAAQLGLSAFSLPKLKRDVASKLQSREGPGQQDAGTDKSNNTQQLSKPSDQAGHTEQDTDTAAPVMDKSPAHKSTGGTKPATARKGRRTKQARVSEQHTVYYDALGSPDNASTSTQQKSRTGGRSAAPPSAHSKPSGHVSAERGEAVEAGLEATFYSSQPEPMDEDEAWGAAAVADADAGGISLKTKTPATAAADNPASTSQQQRQQTQGDMAVRPSSRQHMQAAERPAARKQTASTAWVDTGFQEPEQLQQQTRRQPGSRSRAQAAQAAADAAAMPLAEGLPEEADGATAAAGQGSQEQLRGGQEIYKYMRQLADDAAELLPQEDADGGKKRGRGRPKKDMRLVDALHQCWQGKSYYERLQELTRQEMQAQQEGQLLDTTQDAATLALQLEATALPPTEPHLRASSADEGEQPALTQSQEHGSGSRQPAAAEAAACADAAAPARKRRTAPRQGQPHAAAAGRDVGVGEAARAQQLAEDDEPEVQVCTAASEAGTAAATKAPSSKRRATMHASTAGAAVAGSSRQGRRATVVGGKASAAAAAAAAAAANRSPLPAAAARASSSRLNATWDATPAAAAAPPASLADRPPFTVGGAATAGAAAAAAGTAKADRGALQKLQAAFDAKCEELLGLKDQLKESQDAVAKLRQEAKAHPKALQQLEKQKLALEKKLDGAARREAVLTRENEGLQERLAKHEEEKSALQEQLSKSDREVKALRLKLKQAATKLEKAQTLGSKLQELGAGLMADAQPPIMTDL